MKVTTTAITVISLALSCLTIVLAQDVFIHTSCYEDFFENLDEQMPHSIGNLISLVEKYEREYPNVNIQDFAEGIIHRYKKDGIVYSKSAYEDWNLVEDEEITKSTILSKIIPSAFNLQDDIFYPREECALHFMSSHSTDLYPHSEIENLWSSSNRRRRSENSNVKKSNNLPNGVTPSPHPIEFGVLNTYWGPIAGGTLLYGLSAYKSSSSNRIETILQGDNLDYMPDEMKALSFNPVAYVATLAGDIAQASIPLVDIVGPSEVRISPAGKFAHQTACPRLYMQEESDVSLISRAEIFAGIDALIIIKGLENSQARDMKLSEILRMYYSDAGLPGNQNYKACNRAQLFQELDKESIKEQARYFMYALSNEVPKLKNLIRINKDNFGSIESTYSQDVNTVWDAIENFMNGDARMYPDCSKTTNNDEVKADTQADLTVVLGDGDIDIQRQYISHIAAKIGVSYDRSRLAVLDSKNGKWQDPTKIMANVSNIADWGCNFTVEYENSGGTPDLSKLLKTIEAYYKDQDIQTRNDPSNAGSRNAQVLLWIGPKSGGDKVEFSYEFGNFTLRYPEITVLVVSRNKNDYNFMIDEKGQNYFNQLSSSDSEDIEEFADEITVRIMKSPVTMKYPACDTSNSTYDSYSESSHFYEGYVSPNTTTYFKIGAKEFHFSEYVELKVEGSDMQICYSRTDRFPKDGNVNVTCTETDEEFEFKHPCGRYLEDCDDIYVSIRAKNDATVVSCTDDECAYPNQLKYVVRHDGIVCGTCGLLPTPAVLLLIAIFNILYH